MPDDPLDLWRQDALRRARPALLRRAEEALASQLEDDERLLQALIALGLAGSALEQFQLDPGQQDRAAGLVSRGLQAKAPELRWEAAFSAAALGLSDLAGEVAELLEPGQPLSVRVAAVAAFAQLAPRHKAEANLEEVKTGDPEYRVRKSATDALRELRAGRGPEKGPLARFNALLAAGRVEIEGSGPRQDPRALAKQGLRVPPLLKVFFCEVASGGRLTVDADGPQPAGLQLISPFEYAQRAHEAGPRDRLPKVNDYAWQRYVDGVKNPPQLDEDQALATCSACYDVGALDGESWGYGVLLYEAAFRDEPNRARWLLRARDVLEGYRQRTGEAWDVVDDRLEDVQETIEQDDLEPPLADPQSLSLPFEIGSWEGVVSLMLDLDAQGVVAHDPDAQQWWLAAPTLLELLNDPARARPGQAAGEAAELQGQEGARQLLTRAETNLEQGQLKQAGRDFGDALELDLSPPVLKQAGAILERPELTPLLAGQLLATIPMVGDKKSSDVVKAALQAVPPERTLAVVEALAPYDEAGSQVSLVIDAAAAIRKKAYAEARELAKKSKSERGSTHLRTMRNPFYKEFKK